jgi:hypothetical protein
LATQSCESGPFKRSVITIERVANARPEHGQDAEKLRSQRQHPADVETVVLQTIGQLVDKRRARSFIGAGEELFKLIEQNDQRSAGTDHAADLQQKFAQRRGGQLRHLGEIRQQGLLDLQRRRHIIRAAVEGQMAGGDQLRREAGLQQ